jgi:hypothetical protein
MGPETKAFAEVPVRGKIVIEVARTPCVSTGTGVEEIVAELKIIAFYPPWIFVCNGTETT